MNYAEACAVFELVHRACWGREPRELRPDGRGGWQVTATGLRIDAYAGVLCPAVRWVPGNVTNAPVEEQ